MLLRVAFGDSLGWADNHFDYIFVDAVLALDQFKTILIQLRAEVHYVLHAFNQG